MCIHISAAFAPAVSLKNLSSITNTYPSVGSMSATAFNQSEAKKWSKPGNGLFKLKNAYRMDRTSRRAKSRKVCLDQ